MRRRLLSTCVAAGLIGVVPLGAVHAQSDPSLSASRPGAISATSQQSFTEIVDQDVAQGLYSQADGDALKAKFEASVERVNASLEKTSTSLQKTGSLYASGHQDMIDQAGSLINAQGNLSVGGSPEQIHEQAQAVYNGLDTQVQLTNAALDNIKPLLDDVFKEIDGLVVERANLINANPNVPANIKHNAASQANKLHDYIENSFDRQFQTLITQIQTVRDNIENHKAEIVSAVEESIKTNSEKYGSDPTKWGKPTTPAKTSTTTATSTAPNTQTGTGNQTASNGAPGSASQGSTKRGTVPGNATDPALSATRNGTGTSGTTKSSTSGNASSQASNAGGASAGAKAAGQTSPQGQTPPSTNPDPFSLIKPTKIPLLPVVTPYDPNATLPGGYTSDAPPAPTGNGGNTSNQSQSGTVVIGPSQTQDQLPPPVTTQQPSSDANASADNNSGASSNGSTSSGPTHVGVNPNTQTTAATDDAFNAHRNDPNYDPNAPQTSSSDAATSAGQDAAATAGYAASSVQDSTVPNTLPPNQQPKQDTSTLTYGPAASPEDLQRAQQEAWYQQSMANIAKLPKGNLHLVEGDEIDAPDTTLPDLSGIFTDDSQSVEYGDTITTAALQPIYAGYNLNDNTGDAMTSLDLQVQTPTSVMTVPSMQVQTPTDVMTVPSTQVQTGSDVTTMPSNQINMPTNNGIQPVLCGQ